MMTPPPPPPQQHHPKLFSSLKLALQTLYSLPPLTNNTTVEPSTLTSFHNQKDAHEFLMNFQSRNLRRRFRSTTTTTTSSSSKKKNGNDNSINDDDDDDDDELTNNSLNKKDHPSITGGSTWLTSVYLICQPTTTTTESLFAIQTLSNRLRRLNIIEAVDIEMENDALFLKGMGGGGGYCNVDNVILRPYSEWMIQLQSPFLHQLMIQNNNNPSSSSSSSHSIDEQEEERLKCLIAAKTFVGLALLIINDAATSSGNVNSNFVGPFLETVGMGLATIMLRWRYSPKSLSQIDAHQDATPSGSVMEMVNDALNGAMSIYTPYSNMTISQMEHVRLYLSCIFIGSVPELLSPVGGVRGRLSVDPRCLRLLSSELRSAESSSGAVYFLKCLEPLLETDDYQSVLALLSSLENWVRVLPIPLPYIDPLITAIRRHIRHDAAPPIRKKTLDFLTTLFDSSQASTESIIASLAGLTTIAAGNGNNNNKKKTSSRSKKRREQKINNERSTHETMAQIEVATRRDVACRASFSIFDDLMSLLKVAKDDDEEEVSLAWSCAASLVGVCLPRLVTVMQGDESERQSLERLGELLYAVCSSTKRNVRGLGYEPLMLLHVALVEGGEREGVGTVVVDVVYRCVMALATGCGYPVGYFEDVRLEGDEELEIERNDVRDVIRQLTSTDNGPQTNNNNITLLLLDKLISACVDATPSSSSLPPETALHLLSALAKPLLPLATSAMASSILSRAIGCLYQSCHLLNNLFTENHHQTTLILPVTRLVLIATAAFSPLFNHILEQTEPSLRDVVRRTITEAVRVSISTLLLLPELPPPLPDDGMTMGSTYDPIGAMRNPGGEDHVACLSLMRLTNEGDLMKAIVIGENGEVILELCRVHDRLLTEVSERGVTTSKSRRILLNVISKLGVFALSTHPHNETLPDIVKQLANDPLNRLRSARSTLPSPLWSTTTSTEIVMRIVEATFDLGALSGEVTMMMFGMENAREVLGPLVEMGLVIYDEGISGAGMGWNFETCVQLGRLRAAILTFFRSVVTPTTKNGNYHHQPTPPPPLFYDALLTLNKAECDAIRRFYYSSPTTTTTTTTTPRSSAIFNHSIIGDDIIPAGIYLLPLLDLLNSLSHSSVDCQHVLSSVLQCMERCKDDVFGCIFYTPEVMIPHDDSVVDPRPTVAEVWYLAIDALLSLVGQQHHPINDDGLSKVFDNLIVSSCSAVVLSWLSQTVDSPRGGGRHDSSNNGNLMMMSVDGPQTLVMMAVLEKALQYDASLILNDVGMRLSELGKLTLGNDYEIPMGMLGGGLIVAAFLRSLSGGLPPWAVDGLPKLYAILFDAAVRGGNDGGVDDFLKIMNVAMEIRWYGNSHTGDAVGDGRSYCGGLREGEKLAGRVIDTMSETTKLRFWDDIKKIGEEWRRNNNNGSSGGGDALRKLKVLLKKACGGKKKASGYNLKPSLTCWDCDRV